MVNPEMSNPENDKRLDIDNEEDVKNTVDGPKGSVSREEEDLDNGNTSSVTSIDKADISRPDSRANQPLGSSHEPGTFPGQ